MEQEPIKDSPLTPLDIQQFWRRGKLITVAAFSPPPDSDESYIVKNQKTGKVTRNIPVGVRARIEKNLFGNPSADIAWRLSQRDFIAQQRSRRPKRK
jgi:hypothetical protein